MLNKGAGYRITIAGEQRANAILSDLARLLMSNKLQPLRISL